MRRTVFLLVMLGAIFLLANGASLVSTIGLGQLSAAETKTPATKNAQPEEATGVFHAQFGDPSLHDPNAEARTEFVLVNDEGEEKKLSLDEEKAKAVGGTDAFNGKRVKVKGNRVANGAEQIKVAEIDFERPKDAAEAQARVQAGEPPPPPAAAQDLTSGVSSSKPWVTIGCSFSNSPKPPPDKRGYFEGLMGVTYGTSSDGMTTAAMADTAPGIDHYWKELSFGMMDLNGSQVGDGIKQGTKGTKFWFDLGNQADYMTSSTSPNLTKIANDCTAAADADVNFPDFQGVNLVLDQKIGDASWGGTRDFAYDGQTKTYGVTWLPPFAYGHDWVTHEMGHGLGMHHSSGSYTATYDSEWDVMSGAGLCGADPTGPNPLSSSNWKKNDPYECIADHTIAYHKDKMGWIPPNRKYVAASNTDQTITIDRLGQARSDPDTSSYLMAQIPIKGSSTQFYTVEARRFAGYDNHVNGRIPGEAIVIHKVDTTLSDRNAKVVDSTTADKNPNDAGAMWLPPIKTSPGETYTDKTNGITISIKGTTPSGSSTPTGYSVQIKRSR